VDVDADACLENERYCPSSPYAASKASADHLIRSWSKTYDLPYIITHCCNNYGAYQFPEKLIPMTIISALQGMEIPVYGNGMQKREWLYVQDHIDALIKLIDNDKINTSYNIGSSEELLNIDVVKIICSHLDNLECPKPKKISSFKELIIFVEDRPGHDKRYALNSKKIINDINWTPKEKFQSGIIKTIDWYIDNRSWWDKILKNNYELERKGLGSI
jgi:dTDP-glucose 4,6-dehydratase